MKIRKQLHSFFILLSSITFSSFAYAGGNSGGQIITMVALWGDGAVTIIGDGTWTNPDSCNGTASAKDIAIAPPAVNNSYSEQYAMLLASYLQGKSVSGYLSGCYLTSGGANVPVLRNIIVTEP